jgi:hypothetical protein
VCSSSLREIPSRSAVSCVKQLILPLLLVKGTQDRQGMADQIIGVRPAECEYDSPVFFLGAPPREGELLKISSIVGNNHTRVLTGKLKVSFIAPPNVPTGKSSLTVQPMRSQQIGQQHVYVLIQIHSQGGLSKAHWI